jgi:chromosome partitioning protein
VGCIGMRIDGRTRNEEVISHWAKSCDVPVVGNIRLAQAYVKCMEKGYSIFDLPEDKAVHFIHEWAPLTEWIDGILAAAPPVPGSAMQRPPTPPPSRILQTPTRSQAILERA